MNARQKAKALKKEVEYLKRIPIMPYVVNKSQTVLLRTEKFVSVPEVADYLNGNIFKTLANNARKELVERASEYAYVSFEQDRVNPRFFKVTAALCVGKPTREELV